MFKNKFSLLVYLLVIILFISCDKKNSDTSKRVETEKKVTVAKKKSTFVKPPLEKRPQRVKFAAVLSSWNNTNSKKVIVDFVKTVTNKESKYYIKPENRIATFDSDGTIWTEYPTYFQVEFILYQIKKMASKHPEWKDDELIQTAINHDLDKLRKEFGTKGLGKLMAITQSGINTDQFEKTVQNWIKNAKHPISGRLFSNMIYQPIVELMKFLQENEFKIFVVTVGGVDFIRPLCIQLFPIPAEHIIGSYQKLEYKVENNNPELLKTADILFVNEGKNKVVSIHQFIGKKPVIAFGNSDRDLPMLEWCSSNSCKNLSLLLHHTDKKREWEYDKKAYTGKLDKGLEAAKLNNWLIVDMKKDWKRIFPHKSGKNSMAVKVNEK